MERITVLSIGSDRMMADVNSRVAERARLYGKAFHKMYTIVFSLKQHHTPQQVSLGKNIELFFTNSNHRSSYIFDALHIAKKIIQQSQNNTLVISTQDPFEAGLVGLLLSKKFNIPLHVQIHTDIGSTFFRTQSILNRVRLFIARFVLKQAKGVRVVSPGIKKYLVETYGMSESQITVLPITGNFQPMPRHEPTEYYVLMVSRLEKEKRIDRALQIFKEVLVKKPDLILKIAGKGREEKKLKQLVKKIGIENNVQFLGDVQDVALLYAQASCLLHAAAYEGFGMVLYEAMQTGCPIVTTRVGIASDLQEKHYDITVCDLKDTDKMSRAIEFYASEFKKSHPVNLEFVASDKDIYIKHYVQSICQALGTKLV
ncbi:MAG: hypothetical protein COV34_00985 [Candidatus Zambryskibacteria bacterium CG10_big_fil_rev_8_21_14_0_10_42_12]|uniref:Glycosyl transferase family 1 domain-containing protein n=1 Tax=Candidatus Zambryskibacteria bacterium CG10_big_fil_rev_8_21_14_0_10_42_12 TaxID=1975115 RepID=A0A2H0QVA8_9BACT|nr:MAG: hypothetical protein COV34_00985 [Candidatus Zambryskibacteria bacterium CG10_big_fil_rev_8_21_14_0_10_42_12]